MLLNRGLLEFFPFIRIEDKCQNIIMMLYSEEILLLFKVNKMRLLHENKEEFLSLGLLFLINLFEVFAYLSKT